jgi:hypothetical protein
MRLSKYISELRGLNQVKLGRIAEECLEYIADTKRSDNGLNIYQAKKLMESEGEKVHYKNVHQAFQKLSESGLIELLRRDTEGHAATFYVITTRGWVFLALYSAYLMVSGKSSRPRRGHFSETFKESELFHDLIAHFFEDKTTDRIKSMEFNTRLYKYLRECCQALAEIANQESRPDLDIRLISMETTILSCSRNLIHDILALGFEVASDPTNDKDCIADWNTIRADKKFRGIVNNDEQYMKALLKNYKGDGVTENSTPS